MTAEKQRQGSLSLADVAHQAITETIRTRRYRPGELLSENRIAQELGMSRTPVREALLLLEKEGWIETRPGVGTVVMELTLPIVQKICDNLEVLDPEMAAWAAVRGSKENHEELKACAQTMQAMAENANRQAWLVADTRFHELLGTAADNDIARQYIANLRGRLRRLTANSATRPERLVTCTSEHVNVMYAIVGREPDRARELMREHIRMMRRSVVGMLEQHVIPVLGDRF